MIMKQSKEKFDFKAFGQAIKAARKAKGISRNQLADKLNIAPRYIASIENSGQHPSLQILYELVTLLDVSVDQFFFPEREQEKSTRRRQLDTMLNGMSEKDLKILSATAKGIRHLYRVGVRMLVVVLVCPCVGAFFLPVAYFHFLGQGQLILLIENPL